MFLWGVLKYVLNASDDAKAEGKQFMLWGIIALFVMVSVWGLVNLISRSVGFQNVSAPPQGPGVPRFK